MADDNLDLNAYNGAPLVGTCAAFLSLTWLAVGLRTYTRAVVIKSLQEDDWLMLVAQVGQSGTFYSQRDVNSNTMLCSLFSLSRVSLFLMGFMTEWGGIMLPSPMMKQKSQLSW
jgi:hypothetical protein